MRRESFGEPIQIDGSDHHGSRIAGQPAPYSVFDKDQRGTHAAATENKRLSAMLEHIKAEQDKAPPKKRRSHYKPNGRRKDGWN